MWISLSFPLRFPSVIRSSRAVLPGRKRSWVKIHHGRIRIIRQVAHAAGQERGSWATGCGLVPSRSRATPRCWKRGTCTSICPIRHLAFNLCITVLTIRKWFNAELVSSKRFGSRLSHLFSLGDGGPPRRRRPAVCSADSTRDLPD